MDPQKPRIQELASIISTQTTLFHRGLTSRNLLSPSFDAESLLAIALDPEETRLAIIDAANELCDLLLNPFDLIHHHSNVHLSS